MKLNIILALLVFYIWDCKASTSTLLLKQEINDISLNSDDDLSVLYLKALMAVRTGKWEEALERFESLALSDQPLPADFDFNYAKVLSKNGYYIGSFEKVNQYINDNGNTARYYTEAAALYEEMDKKKNTPFKGTRSFDDGSEYVGDLVEGVIQGDGVMTWSNGDKYEGSWKETQRDGKGTYTWSNGDKYIGEFKKNLRHGSGMLTWKDGTEYKGFFADNSFEGQGYFTTPHDDNYAGLWDDNLRTGKGIQSFSNGDKLDGDWKDDEYLSGDYYRKREKTYADGSYYKGEMKNESRHGFGAYTYANGTIFHYYWENDIPGKAKGTVIWKDKKKYTGDFVNGEIQGYGLFEFNGETYYGNFTRTNIHDSNLLPKIVGKGFHIAYYSGYEYKYSGDLTAGIKTGTATETFRGNKYTGMFKNGSYDGDGIMIFENGDKYEGSWASGKLTGAGTYDYNSRSEYLWYQGALQNGVREGAGRLKWKTGLFYNGSFKNDEPNGNGNFKYVNGDFYDGEVVDGVRHGLGTYTYSEDNSNYRGNWKDGKKHGYGWYRYSDGSRLKGWWVEDEFKKKCVSFCKDPSEK